MTARTRPRGELTASAARYTARRLRTRPVDGSWQERAWLFYDETPEVRFAARWYSNAMGRALLFAGRRDEEGKVVPLPAEHRASQLVAEIAGGPDGQAQLLGGFGPHLTIAGEGWTIVRPKEDGRGNALGADWRVLSTQEGWTTRGRDAATGKVFGPVHGVLNHHTAGRDSLQSIAYRGQSAAVPAPLAHALLPKTGRLVLVADGRANHAGLAAKNSFDAIVAEKPIPKPSKASGTVDGNDALYGLEVENLGDGKDTYTRAQYDSWVRFNAAICRHHDWGAGSCAGHLETSVEGKVDPLGPVEGYGKRGRFQFTMTQLRADVAERLAHPASWSPEQASTPQEIRVEGPAYVNLGLEHGYELAPGLWDEIGFTEEWSDELGQHAADIEVFVTGPARFTGSLSLRLEGLPAGDVVQVRMSEWEGSTLKALHPIHEVIGTPGGAYGVVALVKRLGSGRSMRVRLLNQSAGQVEVASAVLTALVWKES